MQDRYCHANRRKYNLNWLWMRYKAFLSKQYWKKHTSWSDGYFACSIGEALSATIEKYIAEQGYERKRRLIPSTITDALLWLKLAPKTETCISIDSNDMSFESSAKSKHKGKMRMDDLIHPCTLFGVRVYCLYVLHYYRNVQLFFRLPVPHFFSFRGLTFNS